MAVAEHSRRGGAFVGVAAVIGMIATAAPARAQTGAATDRSLAETLFRDARKLMAAKKYFEACPKLAESQRLDPATGTLLNLAVCHAEEGKLATAWVEFNEALDGARHDGRADREKFAREHLAALEPRVSHVTILVPDAARVFGLQVKLDGSVIGAAAWGLAAPVDPGAHELVASAPGRRTWTSDFKLGPSAQNQTIEVPLLRAEAPPATKPAVTLAAKVPEPSVTAVDKPVLVQPSSSEGDSGGSSNGMRTAGFVVGGAGIAALGVGAFFGARAFSKWSDRNTHCPGSDANCDATAVEDSNAANTAAIVADVAAGVGLAAVVTGTILWYRSRGADGAAPASSGASVSLAPAGSGARGATLVLDGHW